MTHPGPGSGPAGPRSEEPLLGPPSQQQVWVRELQAQVRGCLSGAAEGLPVGLKPQARPQSCLPFPSLRGTLSGGRAGRQCPGNRSVGAARSPGHLNRPQSRQTDRQEVGSPGRLRGLGRFSLQLLVWPPASQIPGPSQAPAQGQAPAPQNTLAPGCWLTVTSGPPAKGHVPAPKQAP